MTTTATEQGLTTVELTKTFGGVCAVDHASVEFRHGKINAVIGPNGSGKTTFFNCVTGMIRPDSGTVSYRGRDVTGKASHRIAAAGIGRSFQLCRIFPRMTVLENVLAAARPRGIAALLASARGAAGQRSASWDSSSRESRRPSRRPPEQGLWSTLTVTSTTASRRTPSWSGVHATPDSAESPRWVRTASRSSAGSQPRTSMPRFSQ